MAADEEGVGMEDRAQGLGQPQCHPPPLAACPLSSLLPGPSSPPRSAKVGKPSRSKHSALPSGSLQFRALSKEDHGEWECVATNVVTTITASTHLTVIGR